MGATDGSKTLHSLTELSQKDVADIVKGRARDLGIDRPIVVVDVMNIAFVFSKAVSITMAVVNHLGKWAKTGIVIVPVCDGNIRPICKQATNQRIAASEKCRVKAFQYRVKIRRAKQQLTTERMNQSERENLLAEEQEKSLSRLQRATLSKRMTKDWNELKRLAKKRSIRNIEIKINNMATEKIPTTTPAECTPAKKKQKSAMSVTPSPLKGLPTKPWTRKRKPSTYCAKCGKNNLDNPSVKFHLIPTYPAESKSKKPRRDQVIKRAGRE